MKFDQDVYIIGSGLSGCVIAERFANECNKKVCIVEKRNHIGGNCYDFINELGIRESKYGAHIFHTNSERVYEYVSMFSNWVKWEHRVLAKCLDKLVPIPVNIKTVNDLLDEKIESEVEMIAWLKKHQIKYSEIKNSEEMAKSRIGEKLYDLLIKEYTKKQWDVYPEELDRSVLERIPVRTNYEDRYFTDKYQMLPSEGYTTMIQNMLNHKNIQIILNTDYSDIKNSLPSDRPLFFTGPIDQYFEHLPKLEYRSINFERIHLKDIDYFQNNSVINYPLNDVPFTRIVEYKHFLSQHCQGTTIVKETTTNSGEPYYPIPDKRNTELYKKYQLLAQEEEKKKNIYFVGRLANYKYFNMDQAILNDLLLFVRVHKK